MFKQGDFQVAQGTTPEQLARKRQAIRDMVSKYGTARYTGQGLAHMLTGALNGFKEHRYGKYEGEQQSAASEGFDAATGTEGYEAALANPWTTPEQKSVIAMRMQRDAQQAALARQQAAQSRSAGAKASAAAKAAAERQASMDLVSQFFTQGTGGQGAPAPMAPPTPQAAAMQAYGGPTMGAAQALSGGQDTINGNSGADVLGVGGDTLGGGMSDDISGPALQLSAFDAYNGYKSSEPAPMPQPAPLPEVMTPKPAPMAAPQFDPQMAAQIMMNPGIPKEINEQVMAMAFPDAQAGRAGQAEFGLTPQYGVNDQGEPVIIQLSKDGRAIETPLPDGVKFQRDPIRMDLGTEIALLDPQTRNVIRIIPKKVAEEAAEGARGKVEGEAEAQSMLAAPKTIQQAQTTLRYIDELRNSDARGAGTGMSSMFNFIPGTSGRDYQARVDRLAGGAFLTAIDQLRGLGALSNSEGQTATRAVAALDVGQSEEAFLSALADYERIIRVGMERAQRKLGGPMPDTDMGGIAPAPKTAGEMTMSEFLVDPEVLRAAERAGVTPEAMWRVRQ
jgi:hypothetical protein